MNNECSCRCGRKTCICGAIKRYAVFIALSLAVVLVDQASKCWISRFSGLEAGAYPPYGGHEVIRGFFSIVYNTNTGAAWGMFAGQRVLLAILAVGAVAAILLLRKSLELNRKFMQVIFGLMLGGILGNLIDRVLYGHVTDFLDFKFGHYRWPTFNVADSAMVVAVAIYIVYTLFFQKKTDKAEVTKTENTSDKP
jgi:signal peptidase II